MSNVSSTPPTPPKKSIPSQKEVELSPKSIAAQMGFKRAVTAGEEGTTVSRAGKEPKGEIKEKAIADRSVERGEVTQQEADLGTFSNQLLLEDVLSRVAELSGITDFAEMSKVSKTLNQLSKTTDLAKLKDFSETSQWSIKDEIALRILMIVAQTGTMPSIEDLKKASSLDISLTPEEALALLPQIEKNYKQVQTVWNDLLQNAGQTAAALMPLGNTIGRGVGLSLLSVMIASSAGIDPLFVGGVMSAGIIYAGQPYRDVLLRFIVPALLAPASFPLAAASAATIVGAQQIIILGLAPITQFRTALTGMMDTLEKNLRLPE